jgi:hypothetical protein
MFTSIYRLYMLGHKCLVEKTSTWFDSQSSDTRMSMYMFRGSRNISRSPADHCGEPIISGNLCRLHQPPTTTTRQWVASQ